MLKCILIWSELNIRRIQKYENQSQNAFILHFNVF